PYIQVGQADGNKTGPGEQHVALVQTAQPLPGLVARRAESGAVEAVELSAGQVAQRVTGERVKAKQNHVNEQNQRAHTDSYGAIEEEGANGVTPEKSEENHRDIEKTATQLLHNEHKPRLPPHTPPAPPPPPTPPPPPPPPPTTPAAPAAAPTT